MWMIANTQINVLIIPCVIIITSYKIYNSCAKYLFLCSKFPIVPTFNMVVCDEDEAS
uniref:Uncharacterized protein n=1 Tax=Sander lucioperca TaxID=283035 RepID=A0A8C9ZSG0_SANLU